MQRLARYLIVAALLVITSSVSARSLQSRMEALVRTADLGDATCAFHVRDLADGLSVAEMKAAQQMIPASNAKLVTTAVALTLFKPDFAMRTQLRQADGNLVVVGDGDPAFGDPRILGAMNMNVEDMLARWVDVVKKARITQADRLLIDDRAFDGMQVHPNWPNDQLHLWYCAPVAGINFNDNCLDIFASPNPRSRSPIIKTRPFNAPIVMTNLATNGKRNALWATREPDTNRITVRGTVRYSFRAPIYVTMHDPPMVFGKLLADRLNTAGVKVGRVARVTDDMKFRDERLLAEVKTPLGEIIRRCNKDSQNLFAEALLKRIGLKATGDPGSWPAGSAATRMFLSKFLGPDAAAIVVDDGSGLSRNNRVTADLLTQLLDRMHRTDERRAAMFIDSLPVGGEDGTLARRFNQDKLTGVVRAKSGYIKRVLALSGYIEHDEHTYAFSILLNDFDKPAFKGKRLIDQLVFAIDAYLAETAPAAEPAIGG